MRIRLLLVLLGGLFFCAPLLHAGDCWLAAAPRGRADGSDAANAYGPRKAQRCWDETGPDGTMHVAAGEYSKEKGSFWKLEINPSNDGDPRSGALKTLAGEGNVRVTGSRPVPYKPSNKDKGETWIEIRPGVHNVRIRGFTVTRVKAGIQALGPNRDLELEDLHFEDTRQNIFLSGHARCKSLKQCVSKKRLSARITLRNITGLRYSKRHVRMGQGISQVKVIDSHADGGNLDEDFAVGFDVENPAWDIEFIGCTSRRNRYTLAEYWNGDGFKAESETSGIRWIRCSAFDNADGGFDIKSEDAVLQDVVALRNTRNIRIWRSAVLRNVNGSFSKASGGNASQAGLWVQGKAECSFCTFHNNGIQVHAETAEGTKPKVRLVDSILSLDSSRPADGPEPAEMVRREEGSVIETLRTEEYQEGVKGTEPRFAKAASAWEGSSEDFNSRKFGDSKGYFYPRASS